jgi:hypothetical protein
MNDQPPRFDHFIKYRQQCMPKLSKDEGAIAGHESAEDIRSLRVLKKNQTSNAPSLPPPCWVFSGQARDEVGKSMGTNICFQPPEPEAPVGFTWTVLQTQMRGKLLHPCRHPWTGISASPDLPCFSIG